MNRTNNNISNTDSDLNEIYLSHFILFNSLRRNSKMDKLESSIFWKTEPQIKKCYTKFFSYFSTQNHPLYYEFQPTLYTPTYLRIHSACVCVCELGIEKQYKGVERRVRVELGRSNHVPYFLFICRRQANRPGSRLSLHPRNLYTSFKGTSLSVTRRNNISSIESPPSSSQFVDFSFSSLFFFFLRVESSMTVRLFESIISREVELRPITMEHRR